MENFEFEPQLAHERMLGSDLFQHLKARAVVLELGLPRRVVGVKDGFAASRSAAQLTHRGDLVGGVDGDGVWPVRGDLPAQRCFALLEVLDRGVFGQGSDDRGDF